MIIEVHRLRRPELVVRTATVCISVGIVFLIVLKVIEAG